MSPREEYIQKQIDSGFKAGDYARIVRTATRGEQGWEGIDWKDELTKLVGQPGRRIQLVDGWYGVHLKGTNAYCPFFVLEKTDEQGNPLFKETLIEGKSTNATIFQSDEKRTAIIGNGSATLIGQFTKDELKKFIDSSSW